MKPKKQNETGRAREAEGRNTNNLMKYRVIASALILLISGDATAAIKWEETKGEHFIVYSASDRISPGKILRKAESCLRKISDDLGYVNYSCFWTWKNRVKIYVYPSKTAYLLHTGLPEWSAGAAVYGEKRNGKVINRMNKVVDKAIVTYEMGETLTSSILPHEITHLILCDFVGKEKAPLWLQEGVAQLQEEARDVKVMEAENYLKKHVQNSGLFTLNDLSDTTSFTDNNLYVNYNLQHEKGDDINKIALHYARALSLVNFMAERDGRECFSTFCKQVRDGKSIEEALRWTYPPSVRTVATLEAAWREHITN